MTVSSKIPFVTYDCTGTDTYAYNFKIIDDEDLTVVWSDGEGNLTTLVLNTDYTVSGAGDTAGGSIVTTTAYTGGKITIRRILELTQEIVFTDGGPLPSARIAEALDRSIMIIQQMDVDVSEGGALLDAAAYASETEGFRDEAETFRDEAEAAQISAAAAAAGLDIPSVSVVDEGKVLSVNSSGEYALVTLETASALPIGFPGTWLTATPPDGWVERDGGGYSKALYPEGYAVFGTMYGESDGEGGEGTTHFHVPDSRGRTPRYWDHGAGVDPDATSRTDRGDGVGGDNVGTKQDYATARPKTSSFSTNTTGSHGHTTSRQSKTVASGTGVGVYSAGEGSVATYSSANGNHSHVVSSGGDNETRSVNIYEMGIVKLFEA